MDPYEEVAQQGQAHSLSPAYVPDPMKLDEHVLVYVPEPEHPKYHAPSDDDIQVEDQPYADDASPTAESPGYIADSDSMEDDTDADFIDYPNEPEDGEKDDDEDPEEDPREEHEPEDENDDDDTGDEDEEPPKDEEEEEHPTSADSSTVPIVDPVPSTGDTKAFETDESAPTPRSPQTRVPFSQTRLYRARKTVRLDPPMSASMEARIAEHATAHIPPTNPTYDQAPLGHRAAMIRMRDDIPEEDMPPRRRFVLTAPLPGYDVAESSTAAAARAPRGQYDFVDVVELGQGLIRSPGHNTQTIARAADRAKDVGYVRKKESEDFYTQLLDALTDRRDIRLEIDVVRGQRTAYETELHEVRQAYLSSKAQNRALLARLETLETHMSRMEWQRQRAEDDAVRQIMHTHVLEARARIDTVEDADSSCVALTWCNGHVRTLGHDAAYAMTWGTFKKKLTNKYCTNGEIKRLEIELWNLKVRGNDVAAYTQRFQELALMCTKFLADETVKIDKYIGGLPDNIHGNVMSARPKTLDFAIELANDLMDQKLRTYAERQNENKRKADDSSRNNHQQQPHKKQNVARAYTAGPGEKKNQEFDSGNNVEQSDDEDASKGDRFKKPERPPTPDPDWNKRQHVDFRPPYTWISQVARAEDPPTSFDVLINTPIDFSVFVLNRLNITDLTQEILTSILEWAVDKNGRPRIKGTSSSSAEVLQVVWERDVLESKLLYCVPDTAYGPHLIRRISEKIQL
ncbi:reverse transcriptase domain-containing protein [Tanacetum coccineum]|uniref:Reverse transcriptase domain-containing protein n=1 Tax=Tanacetum coccineum TaxID=301880 RepID=A0ABQ4WEF7_9ASTR